MFKIINGVLTEYAEEDGVTDIIIPDTVTTIGSCAFYGCSGLTSIIIPNSVTTIEKLAFNFCDNLKTKKAHYKAFNLENGNLVCLGYIFKDNEWSDVLDGIIPCKRGYHYCDNLFEVFNYYWGKIDEDIAIYECEVGDKVVHTDTSKCVTNKIKPVKRLFREDVIKILNNNYRIIINGNCYVDSGDKPQCDYKSWLGFDGQRFYIRFFDGREITTNNLWHNGIIPQEYREQLPDNAEFIWKKSK